MALVVALAGCGDDDGGGGDAEKLSPAECRALQAQFDEQADVNELATPGGPGFDRSLDRMDQLDEQMQDGGCYG